MYIFFESGVERRGLKRELRAPGARSTEQYILTAYREAIVEATGSGAMSLVLVVDHPTVAGYLYDNFKIRSVAVMSAWIDLLRTVDVSEVEVSSESRGRRLAWRRTA